MFPKHGKKAQKDPEDMSASGTSPLLIHCVENQNITRQARMLDSIS